MIDVSGSILQPDLAALKTLISKVISQFVITADGEFFLAVKCCSKFSHFFSVRLFILKLFNVMGQSN